jgi:hypothetical protein
MSSTAPTHYLEYPDRSGFFSKRTRRSFQHHAYDRFRFTALPPAELLTSSSLFKDDDGFIEDLDLYAARVGVEVLNMLAHRTTFSEDFDGR